MERPDLSKADAEIRAYIEYLEERLAARKNVSTTAQPEKAAQPDFHEPPTTKQVITISKSGIAKRTARHLYPRQRRGGMGIFDLDTREDDPPVLAAQADEKDALLLFSSRGRAFRIPAAALESGAVRSKGSSLVRRLGLEPDEYLAAALPVAAEGYINLLSERGMVRTFRHHLFGEHMQNGAEFLRTSEFGPLVAACRAADQADLFIATRNGMAIRFERKLVPLQGGSAIRLADGDRAAAITAATQDSRVFLLGADGKGTVRLMSGFAANKSPGGGGKIAMKTGELAAAFTAPFGVDIFIITRLGKMIRFAASEVPATEGVVQGVNCAALRADQVVTAMAAAP
jgi:DNA gyrase subunit A